MITIIDNDNREVAEAADLESAILAIRTCVPEEERDLRAVDPQGAVLLWGIYQSEDPTTPRLISVQGGQRRQLEPRPWAPTRLDERD